MYNYCILNVTDVLVILFFFFFLKAVFSPVILLIHFNWASCFLVVSHKNLQNIKGLQYQCFNIDNHIYLRLYWTTRHSIGRHSIRRIRRTCGTFSVKRNHCTVVNIVFSSNNSCLILVVPQKTTEQAFSRFLLETPSAWVNLLVFPDPTYDM